MKMTKRDPWDITGKIATKMKLRILERTFKTLLTIWNHQPWIGEELYVFDLFAGKGTYRDGENLVYGSPLVFLKVLAEAQKKLRRNLKFRFFFVEKNRFHCRLLERQIAAFLEANPSIADFANIKIKHGDCNKVISEIVEDIRNHWKYPLFVFIDPWGIKIKKSTIKTIMQLRNPKDVMLNYILEGVRRTRGIAKKAFFGRKLNVRDLATLKTLEEFVGEDIDVIKAGDLHILQDYVNSLFTNRTMQVVGCDMPYPDRDDVLCYLLFASRNLRVANIVREIYAAQKEYMQPTFFGENSRIKEIFISTPAVQAIKRRYLLYETGVEYAKWTINHIQGCMHGCNFPCYAFMISKKYGRVRSYNDWRKPKIVANTLELLDSEIPKFRANIDFVHLSFMTDPFMYNIERDELIPEIKFLTLETIATLNQYGIRATTLTKGLYPRELLENRFLRSNEYGISLVSLSEDFKKKFEPFSASYSQRLGSLRELHAAGLRTWVSVEPYPTPNLDKAAYDIECLLEQIGFVDKIIFGKLNYNRTAAAYKNKDKFYADVVKKVIKFCKTNDIQCHIKYGTPCSLKKTNNILSLNTLNNRRPFSARKH